MAEQNAIPKAQDRLDALAKIEKMESEGIFDQDIEDDPPTKELLPNQVDYLQKKLSSKFLRVVGYKAAKKFMQSCIDNGVLRIVGVDGLENWAKVDTGAIIACNHFNIMDSLAMYYAFNCLRCKKRRMYRVIREGNYTNAPGGFGVIMRHCDTLPLSSNKETMVKFMRAVDTLLQRNNFVLVYPEEAMWWNYRKPRPLKQGAYKLAVRSNVPVVPIFITQQDSDTVGPDGFNIQEYTIHVFAPIYPQKDKSKAQNIQYLMDENARVWRECYESTYGKKLTYNIKTKKPANK